MNVYAKLQAARMKLHYPESLFDAYSYNKETGIFSHKKKLGLK